MTVYNGKKVEDSNPVGTNAFVKNELGDLLWEHCENRNDFLPLSKGTFPEDPETHWYQGFNAFPQPIDATAGQVVYMELDIAPGDVPSLKFELRVVCGSSAEVSAFIRQRAAQLDAEKA